MRGIFARIAFLLLRLPGRTEPVKRNGSPEFLGSRFFSSAIRSSHDRQADCYDDCEDLPHAPQFAGPQDPRCASEEQRNAKIVVDVHAGEHRAKPPERERRDKDDRPAREEG